MERYAFQAQLSRISPIGLVARGLRIDVGFAGSITDGPLAGWSVEGMDYFLVRHDGVAEINARERFVGPGGETVSAHAEGYVILPSPMPELLVVSNPEFEWPDVDLPLHGSARLETTVAKLGTVNRIVYGFSGTGNMATGSLVVSAHAIVVPADLLSA